MSNNKPKRNLALREEIKSLDIRTYELADFLQIGVSTLSRWLNERETSEHIQQIKNAMCEIAKSR